jgi:hypothetical protein
MIIAAEQSLAVLAQRDAARLRKRSSSHLSGPSSDTFGTERERTRTRGRKSLISIVTDPIEERQVSMGPEPGPDASDPVSTRLEVLPEEHLSPSLEHPTPYPDRPSRT